MSEPRQTCPVCNGTGDAPVRVAKQLDDARRVSILLREANDRMSFALMKIFMSNAKPSDRLAESFRRIAKECEAYVREVR
jgi:hypothetical protein